MNVIVNRSNDCNADWVNKERVTDTAGGPTPIDTSTHDRSQ